MLRKKGIDYEIHIISCHLQECDTVLEGANKKGFRLIGYSLLKDELAKIWYLSKGEKELDLFLERTRSPLQKQIDNFYISENIEKDLKRENL